MKKGTNSLQILTFLKAGYHITGDKRYEDAFEYLIRDKHFAMNLMQYKILDGHLLHIDDNHDFLMISLLMRYVDDPKLRSVFAMGLTHHWDDEKAEHNAFFNFVYGACTGEQCDIETSVDELADYPMDQILWTLYNSWRDLDWDMRPTEVGMIPQLYHPLPAHERRINSCDSNRFIADSGIAGEAERLFTKSDDPTASRCSPARATTTECISWRAQTTPTLLVRALLRTNRRGGIKYKTKQKSYPGWVGFFVASKSEQWKGSRYRRISFAREICAILFLFKTHGLFFHRDFPNLVAVVCKLLF